MSGQSFCIGIMVILFSAIVTIMGYIFSNMQILSIGLVLMVFGIVLVGMYIADGSKRRAIQLLRARDRITLADLCRLSGLSSEKARQIIEKQIKIGWVSGRFEDDVFIRRKTKPRPVITEPKERIVEREVLVARRIPSKCPECAASVNPEEVDWVGPETVLCPHCGSSLHVTLERV